MVGDPKQAIYRFRGADIATYRLAREAVERQFPGNVLRVTSISGPATTSFNTSIGALRSPYRARKWIMSRWSQRDQKAEHGLPCVVKVKVGVVPDSRATIFAKRSAIVAETCARLIGNIRVRRADRASIC